MRGLGDAVEGRLQAAERALAGRTGTETERPRETDPATTIAVKQEDSGSTELRPTAPEFQPSGAVRNATVGVEAGAGGLVMGGVEVVVVEQTSTGGTGGAARTIRPSPYDGRTAWDAYKTIRNARRSQRVDGRREGDVPRSQPKGFGTHCLKQLTGAEQK